VRLQFFTSLLCIWLVFSSAVQPSRPLVLPCSYLGPNSWPPINHGAFGCFCLLPPSLLKGTLLVKMGFGSERKRMVDLSGVSRRPFDPLGPVLYLWGEENRFGAASGDVFVPLFPCSVSPAGLFQDVPEGGQGSCPSDCGFFLLRLLGFPEFLVVYVTMQILVVVSCWCLVFSPPPAVSCDFLLIFLTRFLILTNLHRTTFEKGPNIRTGDKNSRHLSQPTSTSRREYLLENGKFSWAHRPSPQQPRTHLPKPSP